MANTSSRRGDPTATRRVRDLYDDLAERYDQTIVLPEKLLFGGGRAWIAARARGRVLEIAIGTGRNLPYYPRDVQLTGLELRHGSAQALM